MTVNFNVLIFAQQIFAFMLRSLAFLILRTQYKGYRLVVSAKYKELLLSQ